MSAEIPAAAPKLAKGLFKCFHCRKVYPQKDGNWRPWKAMEVHLCKGCDTATRDRPERRAGSR